MTATGTPRPDQTRLDPHLLRIAAVVVLGTFMSILDTTIINVAVRDLSRDFGASLATTQWISTGYMLALATVIPLTGWAADRYGTKRLYMTSILLFLGGSALSGAAWSMPTLILFRVLQGLGGGMIMPTGMTILSHAAGPARIGRLMGLIGVPMLLGPICGPILGGWLVDDVSWRWIFFVNLPVGAIALYAALRVLAPDEPRPHHALDWQGLLLLSPGLAIFVFGLARIAAAGDFSTPAGDIASVTGLALVSAFVLHALRHRDPLIDVRMFTHRTVGASALTTFLFGTAFFGMSLILPLYFQMVRGRPAFGAGLLLAAQGIGAMLAMPLAARMTDRVGAGRVVLTGLGCVATGMLALSRISGTTPLWTVEPILFLLGLGLGATMMPAMSAAMGSVQRHQIARTTSGLNVVQRVGGSMGTALFAVVLSHQIAALTPTAQGGPAATPATASLDTAFSHTFLWSFGIILLAICPALFLPRKKGGTRPDEGAALSAME
ncbi:DHA2 family efflux MFS transporter permease subunit [Gluconacetobacter takamatsuzukensis]|uniref:DHA2 family efflux MFS transporter permease subunit n=1 Tax=Gluconacetobacter takamatsuzukensis TaxID=1286190 RepID=A0A7W4KBV8_9PROT|nr:DHA2 family efflux MFS transporter permease subunit [Gluconacetobacter takamatsuzukensis]MBB2204063.1 DHA2 family efflux MFS transporter permease subunit [Gluconacetobacter takamatsuzukensis]